MGSSFSRFARHLKLRPAGRFTLPDPFSCRARTLLYIPHFLPRPGDCNVTSGLIRLLRPIVGRGGNHYFFLYASRRVVQSLTRRFERVLSLPILMRKRAAGRGLLSRFVRLNGTLLITANTF